MSEQRIQVTWEESIVGKFAADGGLPPHLARLNFIAENVLVDSNDLVDELSSPLTELYNFNEVVYSPRVMWGSVVEGNGLVLYISAIRNARAHEAKKLNMSAHEWAELAFGEKDINLDGEVEEGFLVGMTAEEDHVLESLEIVANGIISSDIFRRPKRMLWVNDLIIIEKV